jgi:hypothetical protein
MVFEQEFLLAPASLNINMSDHFLWRHLVDWLFNKNQHRIPELKTAIQSQTESTSVETLTMTLTTVLNIKEVTQIMSCQMIKKTPYIYLMSDLTDELSVILSCMAMTMG